MISRRFLFQHPRAIARTRIPANVSPASSHLVLNRERVALVLSSTRTVHASALATAGAAAPALAAAAVPLPSPSSIAPQPGTQQPDFVQEAIQRILKDAAFVSHSSSSSSSVGSPSAPSSSSPTPSRAEKEPQVSKEILETSIKSFQSHLENARLCLKDCADAASASCPEELQAEVDAADSALERAVNAYIDVLDGLREANSDQQAAYEAPRTSGHGQLKELRRQLDDLKQCRVLSAAASESE